MTGILATTIRVHVVPPWQLWLESHIGLILAVLTIVILWRIGGSIFWHLAVALGIGILAEKALNINQISTITSQIAKGKAVGPTGSTPEILGAVVVLFLISAILAVRSPRSKAHRAIRSAMKSSGGGGGEEE